MLALPMSWATTWWPCSIRRRAMLPPMRPSPTIASFIDLVPPVAGSWSCLAMRSAQGLEGRGAQLRQPAAHIGAQVHAQRAPAALGEHAEVPARLSRLDHSERVPGARDLQILGVVAGDLQED